MKRKSGVSFTETMIALAIVGVAITLVVNVFQGFTDQKTVNEAQHYLKDFGLGMSRAMSNPLTCAATFRTHLLATDLKSRPEIDSIVDNAGTEIFKVGSKYLGDKIEITGIQVFDYFPPAVGTNSAGFTMRFKLKGLESTKLEREITIEYRGNLNVRTVAPLDRPSSPVTCSAGLLSGFIVRVGDTMTGPLFINLPAAAPAPAGLEVNNGFVQTNHYFIDSDAKFKTKITEIQNPVALLQNFQAYHFSWKKSGREDWGFIAQEVEVHHPEMVTHGSRAEHLGVKYSSVIPLQIEALKEIRKSQRAQAHRIQELKERIQAQ